jgi:hypothetical protein
MNRYHKEVYTKPEHWQILKQETEYYNNIKWQYTAHCLDNIKNRIIDTEGLLRFIKDLKLDINDIFEYYLYDNGMPEKICYRIPYPAGLDIILVVGEDKNIITIYLNSPEDKHITLKTELYTKQEN